MASPLPGNLRADFGGAGTTVLRHPLPAHWQTATFGSQDDERVYVRLVHDHRMQVLPVTGLGCACHDGVVDIYSKARLRAWSLRMKASAELASWCCHVKLVMSQFFAGTPWGICLSTHKVPLPGMEDVAAVMHMRPQRPAMTERRAIPLEMSKVSGLAHR
jgi:hypothetical protein